MGKCGRRSETGIKRREQSRCSERCVLNVDGSEKGEMCGERSLEPPVLNNFPTSESLEHQVLDIHRNKVGGWVGELSGLGGWVGG